MRVSVIVPVFRAPQEMLVRLIAALKRQSLAPDEILIIETQEDDVPVLNLPEEEGVRVLAVPRSEFDHGRTRNLAAHSCTGDILVYMTQDAEPANDDLLENLVAPLKDPKTPAAYGRQLPRPAAKPTERFARIFNYPDKPMVKGSGLIFYLGIKAVFFSNVCSAVRRAAWKEVGGFPEPIILSEDMILATKLLRRGYQIAYVPEAQVVHSHHYGLAGQFRRYFDIGCMLRDNAELYGIPSPNSEGARFLSQQLRYLAVNGEAAWIAYALAEAVVKFAGYQLGRRSGWMPYAWKAACAMNQRFWRQRGARGGHAAASSSADRSFADHP